LTRDAGFLFAGRVVSAFTTVLVLALIARTSTLEELGVVALGLTMSLALAVLPEAGLTSLFIYDIARSPGRTGTLLGAMLVIRAVALPLVSVAIGVLVVLAYPDDARTIMIVALSPALQQISELARSVFIARRRMAISSAHSIVENVAWASTIAAGLTAGMTLEGMFAAAAVVVAICAGAAFILVAVLEGVHPAIPARTDVGGLLRQAGPFTAFSTLAVVAARMDTVLIGLLLPGGIAIAGAYYTVARLAAAAEYLPEAVSRAIYPRLVQHFADDRAVATSILAFATRDLTAVGIAIPFGFALVGGGLIALLYGPDFAAYGWLLIGFGLAMPFRYVGMVYGGAITSAGLQTRRFRALAVAVVVSLGLNVLLLPRIGIAGALAAGVAGWVVNYLMLSPDIIRSFGRVLLARDVAWSTAVAALGFLGGLLVRTLLIEPVGDFVAGTIFGAIVAAGLRCALWPGHHDRAHVTHRGA
jgi:O-antigen/teichoic acid export membrane protein